MVAKCRHSDGCCAPCPRRGALSGSPEDPVVFVVASSARFLRRFVLPAFSSVAGAVTPCRRENGLSSPSPPPPPVAQIKRAPTERGHRDSAARGNPTSQPPTELFPSQLTRRLTDDFICSSCWLAGKRKEVYFGRHACANVRVSLNCAWRFEWLCAGICNDAGDTMLPPAQLRTHFESPCGGRAVRQATKMPMDEKACDNVHARVSSSASWFRKSYSRFAVATSCSV